jgi:hypothetical protein
VWRSATPGVHGEDSYNTFAYANPVRHVLANVLGTHKEVGTLEAGIPEAGVDRPGAAQGPVVRHAGDDRALEAAPTEEQRQSHVVFKATIVDPVESYLYRPAVAGYLALVRMAKRLQSGRLEAYVGYMLIALIAVLVVAAAMR